VIIHNKRLQTIPYRSRCFFNLTNHDLSPFINIFNLGMKHIPIPQDITDAEITKAFNNFYNRTLWQFHFSRQISIDEEELNDDNYDLYDPKLKVKKELIRPCYLVPETHPIRDALLDFKINLEDYIHYNPTTTKKCQVTSTIKNILSKYPDIVFKPTDKNLGLCAISILDYNDMVMDHLDNTTNYKLVADTGPTARLLLSKLINDFEIFKINTFWKQKERSCINHNYNFKWPKFHCLPKLHKTGPIKGRPIAGQIEWITTPVSRILDNRLQKELYQFPAILPNSYALVKDLSIFNTTSYINNPNIWIITGDIESLYPNINLEILYDIIDRIDITCVALTEFICKNSYLTYNDLIYHQLHGIPMGTNAAVTLANMYVGFLIDRYIANNPLVHWYKRYIDDLFILWTGSMTQWNSMKNSIQRLLKIPIHWDDPHKSQGIFLDLQISRCPYSGHFITSIYQKQLNKYHYITPLSSHAPHMFSGFIKGELTRYARLCNTPFGYENIKHLFYQRLIQRGYQRKTLTKLFRRHKWISRFQDTDSASFTILPFVLPYTLRTNVHFIQSMLKESQDNLTYWFDNAKVIFAHAKRPNIYNRLCSSGLNANHMAILRPKNG
jgi:hypothetical protein